MDYKLIYILFICFFISCNGQKSFVVKQQDIFNITIDTLECKGSTIVTQYINYSNPNDKNIETTINNSLIKLFNDNYNINDNFNLKEYNQKNCTEKGMYDFFCQEYKINYRDSNIISLSYKSFIHSYSPGDYSYINYNLKNGKVLSLNDLLTEKGIIFLIKNTNEKIDNVIKNKIIDIEKKKIEETGKNEFEVLFNENQLEILKDITLNKEKLNIDDLNNYRIIKKNNQFIIEFYHSFNLSKRDSQYEPYINLSYNIENINMYLTKAFKKQIGI